MAGGEARAMSTPSRPGGRAVVGLVVLASVVGLGVSLAAWCFLELTHQIQVGVFKKLPGERGFGETPTWWPLPPLALAGLLVAFAITRLPGEGGHNPAAGLSTGPTRPIDLGGVMLAAVATIGLGGVLGPEAPLIALGAGVGAFAVGRVRADPPEDLTALVAAAGSFAAISFIFGSPLIGAAILIEAAGLDRDKQQVVIPVGLLAAGVGSLVSLGMGAWTGLSTSDYALGTLELPSYARPDVVDFAWTPPLAVAVALGVVAVFALARAVQPALMRRAFLLIPAAGLAVGALAIAFAEMTDKPSSEVLFSGQDQLPGLVDDVGTWSLSALALVIVCKGLAWSASLAAFRGGPTFPGLYLGAAAGVMAAHLPGLPLTPAVAVGMGAGVVAVLRLPLSAVLLATLLSSKAGVGAGPLIIVGVVTAFLTVRAVDARGAGAGPDQSRST